MKIGYARISTREQTIKTQTDALKAAGCEQIYQEVASGMKTERPVLDDLLKHLRAGDTLIICKLDRLGRNLSHLLKIVDDLLQRNISMISLNDPIDTTTAHGRLIFSIFGSVAEYERSLISERTKVALRAAREAGKLGGRPRGFAKGWEDKSLMAETLYRAGTVSSTFIAKQLNISKQTVFTYLRHRGVPIRPFNIKRVINVKQPQEVQSA